MGVTFARTTHPDHDTICAFRRNNLMTAAAFIGVLDLARELKLLTLGSVSLDGTHIKASACQLREQFQLDVKELLEQGETSDREDHDPQKLPQKIARPEKLLGKIDQTCARMEARA